MDIRTLADGETIDGPGAYRCSMSHYHSQDICPGPSISSSDIRTAVLQSPHHFWTSSKLNENRYPEKEPSNALVLGRAAHSLILGDEVFDEHYAYKPDDAPKRPSETKWLEREKFGYWKAADKKAGEWWEAWEKHRGDRLVLTSEQIWTIQRMAENLARSPEAVANLVSDQTEISMIWQDEITGLWIKSRPDCIPTNGCDFGDLKTFAPQHDDLITAAQQASTKRGYPMQMALAIEGAERVFGMTASTAALIFIQTTAPYEPVPIEIESDALYLSACLNRKGINEIAHGLKTGEWPFRAREMTRYSFPPSMTEMLYRMQVEGELPNIERPA